MKLWFPAYTIINLIVIHGEFSLTLSLLSSSASLSAEASSSALFCDSIAFPMCSSSRIWNIELLRWRNSGICTQNSSRGHYYPPYPWSKIWFMAIIIRDGRDARSVNLNKDQDTCCPEFTLDSIALSPQLFCFSSPREIGFHTSELPVPLPFSCTKCSGFSRKQGSP